MRFGIVAKLFMLTTALCLFILGTIFVGQTIFFKQYYADQKVKNIEASMTKFEQDYLNSNGNVRAIRNLEQRFFRDHNTWITVVDSVGNMKHVDDYFIEVNTHPSENAPYGNKSMRVPLYYMTNLEHTEVLSNSFKVGNQVFVTGYKKDSSVIPFSIANVESRAGSASWGNDVFLKKMDDILTEEKRRDIPYKQSAFVHVNSNITQVKLPTSDELANSIYANKLFIEQLNQFQVRLLFEPRVIGMATEHMTHQQNDIKYQTIAKPFYDSQGKEMYLFAIASLQPVDEAITMIQQYFVYIVLVVLVLSVLVSFYYSKKIARPLLRINDTTQKIANLDFSENIRITSKDEIGDLSRNINVLSTTLNSYISQLHQDIEKEKQLENTRKEFIAGVSHELKTPLSIMKSCISILKDGVASHKKDYYFTAMTKEVDRMDMLIVDMLELAKFESGTYKLQVDQFYIDQSVEHIWKQLSMDIASKQLHVQADLLSVEVIANQHRIEQVLTNFMTNAIRYTPMNERVMITMEDAGERVKIGIENKGAHIPQEQLLKIWDRFYRGDAARHRAEGGTGLGLAISKNILELHNVEYGVFNTPDGVLFYFYLNKKM
ncbi:sensor histidine kinase [Paenibacillus sp. 481]|uniref:sensor histidine kinase n=1 Tax=Paenibacillus sp. 481 TaxID=2835869 RepID=UPI001E54EE99|nr:HAMP domain-containing sensor histidine kinase [Paenibacillus sp. 481]UHA76052.1 HAMP domain-containing protein [Paenibacillus sp. 481]